MKGTRDELQTLALTKFVNGIRLKEINRTPKVTLLQRLIVTCRIIFSKKKVQKNIIVKTHPVNPPEYEERFNEWSRDIFAILRKQDNVPTKELQL